MCPGDSKGEHMLCPPTTARPPDELPAALPPLTSTWICFLTSGSSTKTWRAKASGLSVPDRPPHTPSAFSLRPLPGGRWVTGLWSLDIISDRRALCRAPSLSTSSATQAHGSWLVHSSPACPCAPSPPRRSHLSPATHSHLPQGAQSSGIGSPSLLSTLSQLTCGSGDSPLSRSMDNHHLKHNGRRGSHWCLKIDPTKWSWEIRRLFQ